MKSDVSNVYIRVHSRPFVVQGAKNGISIDEKQYPS